LLLVAIIPRTGGKKSCPPVNLTRYLRVKCM
jgi:hypothetical protein